MIMNILALELKMYFTFERHTLISPIVYLIVQNTPHLFTLYRNFLSNVWKTEPFVFLHFVQKLLLHETILPNSKEKIMLQLSVVWVTLTDRLEDSVRLRDLNTVGCDDNMYTTNYLWLSTFDV